MGVRDLDHPSRHIDPDRISERQYWNQVNAEGSLSVDENDVDVAYL